MLVMVKKGKCHSVYRYTEVNNKYIKDYYKNKESSYIQYWDVNNLYGLAMSHNLSVNSFERIENTSQFNEVFVKSYNEESDKGCFLKVHVQYLKKLHKFHNSLPFYLKK